MRRERCQLQLFRLECGKVRENPITVVHLSRHDIHLQFWSQGIGKSERGMERTGSPAQCCIQGNQTTQYPQAIPLIAAIPATIWPSRCIYGGARGRVP
jgi:hypothetical protein